MQRLGRAGPSRIFHAANRTAVTAAAVRPSRVSTRPSQPSSSSSPTSLPPRPPPPSSYDLAQRVIAAGEKGDIDRAIYIVKHSALDSQSTSVWNTLLKEILLAGRFRLSYEVFTDMKRRGCKPNLRTYHTLISGYAQDTSSPSTEASISRARKVHDQYQQYVASLPPSSSEISPQPTNDFLSALANAGRVQDMFDIFWQLPTSGNLSPDKATFTILINALRNRKALHAEEGAETPAGAQTDVWRRNADDIRFIWKQLVSASERKRFRIDGFAIAPTLFALAKGSPEAQEEAFSIVHDYLGFSPSAEEVPRHRRVDLSPQLLTAALELCVLSGQHERCLHYVRSVMANPTDAQSAALSNRHMLYAYDSLAALSASLSEDPQSASAYYSSEAVRLVQRTLQEEQKGGFRLGLRPDIATYSKVFLICRRAKDWASTRRLLELMTGFKLEDFDLPLVPADARGGAGMPTNSTVPRRFQILPDAGIMNLVMRAAFASATSSPQLQSPSTPSPSISQPSDPASPLSNSFSPSGTAKIVDPGPMYLSLRLISHFTPAHFFSAQSSSDSALSPREQTANQRRLAQSTSEVVDALLSLASSKGSSLPDGSEGFRGAKTIVKAPTPAELAQWKEIRDEARGIIRAVVQRRARETRPRRTWT